MKKENIKASDFFVLGLYAFAGFGLEILLIILLPNILGVQQSEHLLVHDCIHWILTCILWGSMTLFLSNLSKKKYSFDMMKDKEKPNRKQWLGAAAIAIIAIVITTIVSGGLKPVQEYHGIVKFIGQNIYYLFESALILLTIIFGQKFGELLVKKDTLLPYGGIFLALTWGLVHILTQGPLTGIYTFAMSILYGLVYILLRKNTIYSYIFITVMFIF